MNRSIVFVSLVSMLSAGVFVVGCSGADGQAVGSSSAADSVEPLPPVPPVAPPAGEFACGNTLCDAATQVCERRLLTPGPLDGPTPELAGLGLPACAPIPANCATADGGTSCDCVTAGLDISTSTSTSTVTACTDVGGDIDVTVLVRQRFLPFPPPSPIVTSDARRDDVAVDPLPPISPAPPPAVDAGTDAAPSAPGEFACGVLASHTCNGATQYCELPELTPGPVPVDSADPSIVSPIGLGECETLPTACTGANATCDCIEAAIAASVSPIVTVSFPSCTDDNGDVSVSVRETRKLGPILPQPEN